MRQRHPLQFRGRPDDHLICSVGDPRRRLIPHWPNDEQLFSLGEDMRELLRTQIGASTLEPERWNLRTPELNPGTAEPRNPAPGTYTVQSV